MPNAFTLRHAGADYDMTLTNPRLCRNLIEKARRCGMPVQQYVLVMLARKMPAPQEAQR
jgi:hypothetical protein